MTQLLTHVIQPRSFNEVIENYLIHFIGRSKAADAEQAIPDVVLSLLGVAEPVSDDDLND